MRNTLVVAGRTMKMFPLVLLLSVFAIDRAWSGAPRYVAKEIHFPNADSISTAGLNDCGQVVGTVCVGNSQKGFLVTKERIIYFDHFFPGTNTGAVSINNRGEVIVWAGPDPNTLDQIPAWFIYSNNTVRQISTLGGYSVLDVGDINDRGEFVGHCSDGRSVFTFIFSSGHLALLTQLPPFNRGHLWLRLNNHGQVVAYDDYLPGTIVTTNSITPLGIENNTRDINDAADVVGTAQFGCCEVGFLYSGQQLAQIFGLPGHSFTVPTAINNRKQVVGYSFGDDTSNANLLGFLFEDGVTFALNEITGSRNGFTLINPVGINNHGMVACLGFRDGRYSAFLLKPVGKH